MCPYRKPTQVDEERILRLAFKNFIYEMYSRDLSENVKSGVTTCMKRGEYYAGCMVYGYQKSMFVISVKTLQSYNKSDDYVLSLLFRQ